MRQRWFKIRIITSAMASMLATTGLAAADEVHLYTNYDQSQAPGYVFPTGADLAVRVVISCPGSVVPAATFTLPAGGTEASFVTTAAYPPLFQYLSFTVEQDYPVKPTRLLWRLSLATSGVSGYIQAAGSASAHFNAPDCVKPWQIAISSTWLTGAYAPGNYVGITPTLKPFPDEP